MAPSNVTVSAATEAADQALRNWGAAQLRQMMVDHDERERQLAKQYGWQECRTYDTATVDVSTVEVKFEFDEGYGSCCHAEPARAELFITADIEGCDWTPVVSHFLDVSTMDLTNVIRDVVAASFADGS